MDSSRLRFMREFKLADLQRLEKGLSVAKAARAFEVNPNVLHRWRPEFCQWPSATWKKSTRSSKLAPGVFKIERLPRRYAMCAP